MGYRLLINHIVHEAVFREIDLSIVSRRTPGISRRFWEISMIYKIAQTFGLALVTLLVASQVHAQRATQEDILNR